MDPSHGPFKNVHRKFLIGFKSGLFASKLQHYWNLTIRLFISYPGHSLDWWVHFCREAVGAFYYPSRQGKKMGCLKKGKYTN